MGGTEQRSSGSSTKTQNEENRAVMGREFLWAVCSFEERGRGHPWGAYEGPLKQVDNCSEIGAE